MRRINTLKTTIVETRDGLAFAVVRALASEALHENLDAYECERIVAKMKGKSYIIPVPTPGSAPVQLSSTGE